jgi:hypothetical protein
MANVVTDRANLTGIAIGQLEASVSPGLGPSQKNLLGSMELSWHKLFSVRDLNH